MGGWQQRDADGRWLFKFFRNARMFISIFSPPSPPARLHISLYLPDCVHLSYPSCSPLSLSPLLISPFFSSSQQLLLLIHSEAGCQRAAAAAIVRL